jgi:hypothetical protein
MSEIHQHAKDEWMRKFEGAKIVKTSPVGSPTMRHLHKRSFDHVGRNCHFITVFGRILLGEDRISEAEEAVTKRLDDVIKAIERKISAMTAIVAEASLTDSMASFNRVEDLQSDIVVPNQNRFLTTIVLGDKYLVLVNTLWLHGQLDDKAKSRAELELKQLLRSIPATTRKMRIYLQTKLRAEAEKKDAPAEVKKVLKEAEAVSAGPSEKDLAEGDERVAAAA